MPSAIEWTDETWNPVTGCDRVSPGCAHCYALTLAKRLKAMGQPRYQRDGDPKTSGPGFGVTLHPDLLDRPLRWRRPRMVFVNSMSDLFHEEIPIEFIERVYMTMLMARQHTFQVLTKRPERALWFYAHYPRTFARPNLLPNVWLGVSIENARYTWRADVLREIPATVRFISAEPLLGSLFDARGGENASGSTAAAMDAASLPLARRKPLDLTGIDWVIVGGESGPGARPMHPDWARELRDSIMGYPGRRASRPAFFFKQWGSWSPVAPFDSLAGDRSLTYDGVAADMRYRGAAPKSGGRVLDGREWNEMPALQAVAA